MIIAIHNFKGGTGKTTTAVNIGSEIQRHGFRVILIDLSNQADLTYHLCSLNGSSFYNMYNVANGEVSIWNAIIKSNKSSKFIIDLIPSGFSLSNIYQLFKSDPFAGQSQYVEQIKDLQSQYDFIILDCFNNIDTLEYWSFLASDLVICPVCDLESAKNVSLTIETIKKADKFLSSQLRKETVTPFKILLTNLEKIDTDNMTGFNNEPATQKELREIVTKKYNDNLFNTIIKRFNGFSLIKKEGLPIMEMFPHFNLYNKLFREIYNLPEIQDNINEIKSRYLSSNVQPFNVKTDLKIVNGDLQ